MGSIHKILLFNLKKPWLSFSIALLFSIAGYLYGKDIPARLSLMELLPSDRESVTDFRAVSAEVGGVGYLSVIIGPMEAHTERGPQQYLSALSQEIQKLSDVKYVFYERETYVLRDKSLYLLPRSEFDTLVSSAETLLRKGTTGGVFDLGLDDDNEVQANLEQARGHFDAFRKKYFTKSGDASDLSEMTSRYLMSSDGRYAVVRMKPAFDSEDIARDKILIRDVNAIAKKILPEGVPFQLSGRPVDHVGDTEQVNRDIGITGIASGLGILCVLIFGLGTIRGAVLTVFLVTIAMGWTLGFAQLVVGQINLITGFLLAILGGLGVEYGVHLIRRYYQEIDHGLSQKEAAEKTYVHVGRALFSAALTSSGAFLILSFSDFRGFSELGKIAGFGVLSIFTVFGLCFPAMVRMMRGQQRFKASKFIFGFYPASLRWIYVVIPFVAVAIFGGTRTWFEYDFDRMRELSHETIARNKLMSDIMGGRSGTPAALMAVSSQQASEVRHWLIENGSKAKIDEVYALRTVIPEDMSERDKKLVRVRRTLARATDAEIKEKTGIEARSVRNWVKQEPYGESELPIQMKGAFGENGNIILVYTKESLSHADGIRRFAGLLMEAKIQFPGLKIGSDTRIFTEILQHIIVDGKIVMALFLLGAFIVLLLDFRSLKDAALLELQLILGIGLLVCFMGLFDVPFTILNVAMIPAVLAAGIDMGVHVRHRMNETKDTALQCARFVTQAVNLGVLTSLFGFGALFLAEAKMLKGIAWISCLGQISMYLICMIFVPVVLDFFNKRKAS